MTTHERFKSLINPLRRTLRESEKAVKHHGMFAVPSRKKTYGLAFGPVTLGEIYPSQNGNPEKTEIFAGEVAVRVVSGDESTLDSWVIIPVSYLSPEIRNLHSKLSNGCA